MTKRVLSFYIRAAINSRSTRVVTIQGPALIAHINYTFETAATLPVTSLELGIGSTNETDVLFVPTVVKKPFDPMFEHVRGGTVTINAELKGLLNLVTQGPREAFLKLPIFLGSQFDMAISLINAGAAANAASGLITVWEAVPDELLRCFLD